MSSSQPHCLTCDCETEEACNAAGCSCFNCYPGGHLDTDIGIDQ